MEHPDLRWLYVYLTRNCNLKCTHCWLDAGSSDHKQTLPMERVLDVARQGLPLGLNEVRLTGGEPTIVPYFHRLLLELQDLGVHVHLETNAMAITRPIADTLAAMQATVAVSLDGDPEYHDCMRGIDGAYTRTTQGMDLLAASGVPMMIIMAVRQSNLHLIDHVTNIANQYNISGVKINPILPMGRGAQLDDLLSSSQLLDLNRQTLQAHSPSIQIDLPPSFYPLTHMDRAPRCHYQHTLSLLANGHLALCGLGFDRDDWRVGSLPTDLQDLWHNSTVLQLIRQELPRELEGICADCLMKATCCGSCRALSLVMYGSWTAPNPRCVELYEMGLFPSARRRSFSPTDS